MRIGRLLLLAGLSLLATSYGVRAEPDLAEIYQAKAIVTGTGEVNRQIGFRDCLLRELVKVSGDQRILDDPHLPALLAKAGSFVQSFRYHDRLAGIPIHDEQGTHDRPHDLTCIYQPSVIDPLLGGLGRKPWLAARPKLVVFLSAQNAKRSLVLARDKDDGFYMRDSFVAAAAPLAIPILFPSTDALRRANIEPPTLSRTTMPLLDALAKEAGGDQALAGTIVWSDRELGWIAEWRLARQEGVAVWHIKGVSFDEAFRNAMRGAAQVLSGNGTPQ